MPPKAKNNTVDTSNVSSVAAVAASNVEGYLRNASLRQRVPLAEGGRGTRRKMAMVTSAAVHHHESEQADGGSTAAVDADDEEWDNIALPTTVAAPARSSKKEEAKQEEAVDSGSGAKREAITASAKEEEAERRDRAGGGVKNEPFNVDADADAASEWPPAALTKRESFAGPDVMEGSRAPLSGQERRPWGQRGDDGYAEAQEQKDALAALRRAERMRLLFFIITNITALFVRLRLLWREAHHPATMKRLLRCYLQPPAAAAGPPNKKRARREASGAAPAPKNFVFLDAVTAARERYREACSASAPKKPSLAPAWVNHSKDAVSNHTSSAIGVLIGALHTFFTLRRPEGGAKDAAPAATSTAAATEGTATEAKLASLFSSWDAPLVRGLLTKILIVHRAPRVAGGDGSDSADDGGDARVLLPSPIYFSVLFIAMAALAGMRCRLVLAMRDPHHSFRLADLRAAAEEEEEGRKRKDRSASETVDVDTDDDTYRYDDKDNEEAGEGQPSRPRKLQLKSVSQLKKETKKPTAAKRGRGGAGESAQDGVVVSKKMPSSCVWVEVWCPQRSGYIAVNPCSECSTLWGAPYTFALGGGGLVDVTARYTSKYSTAFGFNGRLGQCKNYGFLWKDSTGWEDAHREVTDVLIERFNAAAGLGAVGLRDSSLRYAAEREAKQLELLKYSEPVPTTLAGVRRNPLFVLESDLARFEGIYPKTAQSTVGSVRGHPVYKRSAVVPLRSRDGWLREHRSILPEEDETPYRMVPPPSSRPFAPPSQFFGVWQTKPFEPRPLTEEGKIPLHGHTSWYVLLDKPAPEGLVHLREPQIVRVARRMNMEFGLALVGFNRRRVSEMRRGHWEAVIDGIVVKATSAPALVKAYGEWIELVQAQEAAKRQERAFRWWLLFSQRLLAMNRLEKQYAQGLKHGGLPTM